VGGGHSLYYELHGKACGVPALFLHGGPGAGCAQRHAGFFDPAYYQTVLFDQRGCGRSTPKGCLDENDTVRLVEDCETLRTHLGFDRWGIVLGGSWGVTLALAYAAAFPRHVGALVLRAVCLMRLREIDWVFGDNGGARRMMPAGWAAFRAVQEKYTSLPTPTSKSKAGIEESKHSLSLEVLSWYASALASDGELRSEAATGWHRWEMSVFGQASQLPPLVDGPADTRVWKWEPEEARWVNGKGAELDTAEVRHALCEGFEPRVTAALASRLLHHKVAAVGMVAASKFAANMRTSTVERRPETQPNSKAQQDSGMQKGTLPNGATGGNKARGERNTLDNLRSAAKVGAPSGWVPAQAVLTAHYSVHAAFMGGVSAGDASREQMHGMRITTSSAGAGAGAGAAAAAADDGGAIDTAAVRQFSLLEAVPLFRHIPCVAVQGGNDLVCPPVTAYELHSAWPEMQLCVVHGAGHSMYDSGLQAAVIQATDSFRDVNHMPEA